MINKSNLIAFTVTLLVFGLLLPLWKGIDFLDAPLILISMNIPLLFVAPLVATGEPNGAARARIGPAVVYSVSLAVFIIVNAIATVNIAHRMGNLVTPGVWLMTAALALNATASLFVAALTAMLLRRMPPARVKRSIRIVFLTVLLGWVLLVRVAPPAVRDAFDEYMTTEALARGAWIASGLLIVGAGVVLSRR